MPATRVITRTTRRATASPSPAPSSRAGSPRPAQGATIRTTPIPARYSTSYGSPLAQLPDRGDVMGGGDVTKAAAEIFTRVNKDKLAAQERRRAKQEARAARAANEGGREVSESPEPLGIRPSIEKETSSEEDGLLATRAPEPAPRKRTRNDEEAEARVEKERKERDDRLRRERSAEAQKRVAQKLAEAQAEAQAAEEQEIARQKHLAEQAARDAAARAAMPPPPHQPVPRRPSGSLLTPASPPLPNGIWERPSSARSYIEEGRVFNDATVQTPARSPLADIRRPVAQPPAALSPEPVPPSSELRKSPRRPRTRIQEPQRDNSPSPERRRRISVSTEEEPSSPTNEEQPQHKSQTGLPIAFSLGPGFRNRFKSYPQQSQSDSGGADVEEPASETFFSNRPSLAQAWDLLNIERLFRPWSIFKIIAGGFLLLHAMRFAHILARPDIFESPVLRLNWYGWRDWTSNVGQFFPSPLLHPLGVLSPDQYDDLKDYLEDRTTSTEAALDNLRAIIPKIVSVQKDAGTGRVVVSEEFWLALRDRLKRDQSVLTLDDKSRISDKHWNALQERLKSAGLLDKTMTPAEVEDVVEKLVPQSWEKWAQKNQRKVADILGRAPAQGKPSIQAGEEFIMTRDEFIRELKQHVAESRAHMDKDLDVLRSELRSLADQVKAAAAAAGIPKAEIKTLVQNTVAKAIGDLQLKAASKAGAGGGVDDPFRRHVNHFSPGNGALVEISLTSPVFAITPRPKIFSKRWFKFTRKTPQFQHAAAQALTPWAEAGDCWCAGIAARNSTTPVPADLGVRLAQFIVPQYVVVEHIEPSATRDPLAMPRDIEVWAAYDKPPSRGGVGPGNGNDRFDRVLDWMAAKFPEVDPFKHRWAAQGLAKIGAFTYEHKEKGRGVFVHKLSDDLERMGAATDMVALRAVTNYGAKDHTCFYRVRLYGKPVDQEG